MGWLKVPPGDAISYARIPALGDVVVTATNPPLWCPTEVYDIACREATAAVFVFSNSAAMQEDNIGGVAGFRSALSRMQKQIPVLNVLNNPWCIPHPGGLITEASLELLAFGSGEIVSTRIGVFGSHCIDGVESIASWIREQVIMAGI